MQGDGGGGCLFDLRGVGGGALLGGLWCFSAEDAAEREVVAFGEDKGIGEDAFLGYFLFDYCSLVLDGKGTERDG